MTMAEKIKEVLGCEAVRYLEFKTQIDRYGRGGDKIMRWSFKYGFHKYMLEFKHNRYSLSRLGFWVDGSPNHYHETEVIALGTDPMKTINFIKES
jgi:hypothetical protein